MNVSGGALTPSSRTSSITRLIQVSTGVVVPDGLVAGTELAWPEGERGDRTVARQDADDPALGEEAIDGAAFGLAAGVFDRLDEIANIAVIRLKSADIVRHPLVSEMLDVL